MKIPAATPREGMPFSNSDEGMAFTSNWCDRCIHDKPARQGRYEDACGILTLALTNKIPGEWIEQEWGVPPGGGSPAPPIDRYHCIEFRDERDGPPPPTEPAPTPPGQGELIPMEPYVGTRMFSDVVAEARPTEVDA
jgi:hypothetical protein